MSRVFTLRIKDHRYQQLKLLADERGMSVALMVREMIDAWIIHQEQSQLTSLDKAQLKALSETLYIVRAMADKLEPDLKEAASQHAQHMIQAVAKEI